MAMGIGGKRNSFFISRHRWERFAQDIRLPEKAVLQLAKSTAESILTALDTTAAALTKSGIPENTIQRRTEHIRFRTAGVLEHLEFPRN